jgi:hypothetical protein
MQSTIPPQTSKNIFKLQLKKEGTPITLSSNFDSGNMGWAEVGLSNSIIITPANDCAASDNPSHSKGWFYFSVLGVPIHTKVKFIVKKMQQLSAQVSHPLFRLNSASTSSPSGGWERRDGSELSRR